MVTYAQLDENGVCIGVSQLSDAVDAPHMISLAAAESVGDCIGRTYADGVWGDAPAVEEAEPQAAVSLEELLELQMIQLEALATLYETITGEESA